MSEIRKGDQVVVRGRVVDVTFSTAIIEVGPGLYGLVPVPVDALALVPDPGPVAGVTP
jgi:hypothetical protein